MDEPKSKLYILSRFLIFVPIVIVLVAFYLKYTTPEKNSQNTLPVPSITQSPKTGSSFADLMKPNPNIQKLDLNGPYICDYTAKDKTVNTSVKNKNIYVEYTTNKVTTNMLVNKDCGYKWVKGQSTGEKMCGISQLMSVYENIAQLPFVKQDTFFSMIGAVNPSITIAPEEMSAMSKSCKKQEVADSVFNVPYNVNFQNKGTFTSTPQ